MTLFGSALYRSLHPKRRLQSLDDQLSADSIVGRLRKRRLFEAEDDVKA